MNFLQILLGIPGYQSPIYCIDKYYIYSYSRYAASNLHNQRLIASRERSDAVSTSWISDFTFSTLSNFYCQNVEYDNKFIFVINVCDWLHNYHSNNRWGKIPFEESRNCSRNTPHHTRTSKTAHRKSFGIFFAWQLLSTYNQAIINTDTSNGPTSAVNELKRINHSFSIEMTSKRFTFFIVSSVPIHSQTHFVNSSTLKMDPNEPDDVYVRQCDSCFVLIIINLIIYNTFCDSISKKLLTQPVSLTEVE